MRRIVPLDVFERTRHETAYNDQGTTSGPGRDGGNNGSKEDTNQKEDSAKDSRHASASTSFDTSGRLNVGRDGGESKEGTSDGSQRIGGKGLARTRKVSVFVSDTHGNDQGQQGSGSVEKVDVQAVVVKKNSESQVRQVDAPPSILQLVHGA